MKLIDSLQLKGQPAEIPDCSRDDLPQFFVDLGHKVAAEIGVDRGEYSQKFCEADLKLYAIDPWQRYKDYEDTRDQKHLDHLHDTTKKNLSQYPNYSIVRKTSIQAAETFADNSLDFVYIDRNHQLKYVIEDLVIWSKKVRVGGIISGHDYIYTNPQTQAGICHVIYAVNAFTRAYKIDNWYLLGRKERLEDDIRDRFRS